jgi:hypothetical protein
MRARRIIDRAFARAFADTAAALATSAHQKAVGDQ